jgi:glycyl-tRNA synthetase beta chain
VKSGNTTMGHRFLSNGKPIAVRHFDDYIAKLRAVHVVLDAEERKAIIFEELKEAAFVRGLELIADEALLDEVSGLAEWPVVLIGAIEDDFMDVPPEILQTSMRTHQKYFSLRYPEKGGDPKSGKMANRFAVIANMVASDGGKEIIAGNERVLRARLSDAKFFWDQDRKRTLESRVDDLKSIVFHAKLGTQYQRITRIEAIAGEIAATIGADVAKAKRAALLCKADLTTGVVGEFPELQGVMGRYYALHDGEDGEVADAVRDHYRPVGRSDVVPANKVSIAVALADKIDQLAGFWLSDLKPTGSSDPFALRRAGLGYIRIVTANELRLPFGEACGLAVSAHLFQKREAMAADLNASARDLSNRLPGSDLLKFMRAYKLVEEAKPLFGKDAFDTAFENTVPVYQDLAVFLGERLMAALNTDGLGRSVLRAVFSLGGDDDFVRLTKRSEALQRFLKTDEGANLLAGYKRGANILKAEEKKNKTTFDGAPDATLLSLPEEKALAEALAQAETSIAADVKAEKFVEAMGVMAKLRAPVDAFFEKVKVNDADARVRENRLKLLSRLRATLHQAADFSKIEG